MGTSEYFGDLCGVHVRYVRCGFTMQRFHRVRHCVPETMSCFRETFLGPTLTLLFELVYHRLQVSALSQLLCGRAWLLALVGAKDP